MSFNLIREKLLNTIVQLQAGNIKKEDAIAVSQLSQTFINSVKVEVESAKLLHGIGFKLSDVFGSEDVKALNANTKVKYLPGMRVKLFNKMIGIIKSVDDANMKVCITDSQGFNNDYLFEEIEKIIN